MQYCWLQEDIEEMLKHCDKPLIFPLSNPSSKAEITAEKAYEYSHGKCVYASGIVSTFALFQAAIHPCKRTWLDTQMASSGYGFASSVCELKVLQKLP